MRRATGSANGAVGFLIVTMAVVANADTFYVNGSCGNDAWTGTSSLCSAPDGPKLTIQAGINASVDGDTVIVADGTYIGVGNKNLNYGGRLITLRSENGPAACIIDCEGSGSGITFVGDASRAAVVDGFTITNGRAFFGGGAMQFSHIASPTIRNCIMTGNAADEGGALYIDTSASPLIENCRLTHNTANRGGAIRVFGEGISSAEVVNCVVSDNHAALDGGGVFCEGPSPIFVNCVVAANSAQRDGGGFFGLTANLVITNCTITDNWAGQRGGGLVGAGATFFAEVRNSVVWDNSAPIGHEIALLAPPFYGPATLTLSANDIVGGQLEVHVDPKCTLIWGPGNIAANPLHIDPGGGNYRLSPGSPAIDAADNTEVPAGVTTDLDGNARFVDDPNTPDTGNGTPPIVDMGAYEFQCDPCDMNCDGSIDAFDIDAFLDLLFRGGRPCDICTGDVNGDGVIDAFDIEPFLECLFP